MLKSLFNLRAAACQAIRFSRSKFVASRFPRYIFTTQSSNVYRTSVDLTNNHKGITGPLTEVTYEPVCRDTLDSLAEYFEELVENCTQLKDSDVTLGVSSRHCCFCTIGLAVVCTSSKATALSNWHDREQPLIQTKHQYKIQFGPDVQLKFIAGFAIYLYSELEKPKFPVCNSIKTSNTDGVLTLKFGSIHGTYVINRQRPNLQLWLSSPLSGPKRYDFVEGQWIYKHDNVSLHKLLEKEISAIAESKLDLSNCAYA